MNKKNNVFNDFNSSTLAEILDFTEKAEHFRNERKKFRRIKSKNKENKNGFYKIQGYP